VRLAFLTCAAEQAPFYKASSFRRLGVLPGHYPPAYRASPASDGTAAVMLLALCPRAELAEYQPQAAGQPPNLLHERLEDADGLVVAATFVQGLAQIEARAKRILAKSGLPQR
jgi:hypothetical protein